MTARVYYYAEVTTRTQTTTTDWSTVKVTLTFTPNASKTYAIFWCSYVDGSTNTLLARTRLQKTTGTAATLAEISDRPYYSSNAQKMSFGGLASFTSGASPIEETFQIQVASETASQTLGISEASITAIELGADDIFNESLGVSNSTSGTYATKVTASFTPPSAGDYLIISSMGMSISAGGAEVKCRVYNGTTAYSELPIMDWGGVGILPYFGMRKATNLSAAQTWTGQFARAGASGTGSVRHGRILAFRLADFEANFYGEDRTSRDSTNTTFADAATTGANTPAAVDHFVVACGNTTIGDANSSTYAGNKIDVNGSDVGTIISTNMGYIGYYFTWLSMRKRTESATSTTWKTRYNRVSGGTTATTDENVIAVLQLDTSGAPAGQPMMKRLGGVPFVGLNQGVW